MKTLLGLFLAPGRVVHRYLYDDREALIRPLTYLVVMLAFVAASTVRSRAAYLLKVLRHCPHSVGC